MSNSNIHIFATGGTIANPPEIDGYLTGEALVRSVEELSEFPNISVTDVASLASSAIVPKVWYDLHEEISSIVDGPSSPDGIVITHGSNTVEETAYFLNLTLDTDIPVVLTAAQRNHGTVGNDGNRNLVDAVRTAVHPEAGGRGVLVVTNDEIHQAREVTKVVSGRPDAWSSGDFGPIGLTDKYGLVRFYRRTDRRHTIRSVFDADERGAEDFPTIEVVYSTAGGQGTLVEAAVERNVDGLVVAAFPTGSSARPKNYPGQEDALQQAAAEGLPIVISHRGSEGWPRRSLIEDEQFIWGDTLRPQKARILLALGLQQTRSIDELQSFFLEY